MSKRQVQRAREIIQELGFAVTVLEGSYLTRAQRQDAHERHGGFQLRAASTRALTIPKPLKNSHPVENVHLPLRPKVLSKSSVLENLTTRASALREAASQPKAARRNNPKPVGQKRTVGLPRPLEEQRFAARLAARMPWLVRGRHIGQLMSAVARAGVDTSRWTVGDLLDAIERFTRAAGISVTDPGAQRDPLGYLVWLLKAFIEPGGLTPTEQREADYARKVEAQRRAREEDERERERASSVDDEDVARIIAAMRVESAAAEARLRQAGRLPTRTRRPLPPIVRPRLEPEPPTKGIL
ncbi:hypothetical protein QN358_12600 [Subtercola sp. RTI3]|nr:hypothetical protein [Subtercola sp. RTI3]